MLYTLEVLPAAEGDCLLLHWRSGNKPRVALIDGGPRGIYQKHLRKRLEKIAAKLGGQLALELVMVSHMDSDHIIGIRDLVRDLKSEVQNHVLNRPIRMKRLWLNVFNDILGDAIDKYYKKLTASLQASVDGKPNPEVVERLTQAFIDRQKESAEQALHDAWAMSLVLAGHGDGRDVRDDQEYLFDQNQTAALNSPFRDEDGRPTLITLEKTPEPEKIAGVSFRIAGPMQAEIEALQKEFDDYIADHGLTGEAVLAAYADTSAKNLSSIVCLAEFEGKSILFTGDARGDKILKGLVQAGLLEDEHEGPPLRVDVFKVPHHGSDRNVKRQFFDRIVADTYVLSGDGQNGNPDRATLEWIIGSRGKDEQYDIVLTYSIDEIDETRRAYYAKKHMHWSDEDDSLAALFAKTDAGGYAFTLHAGAPFRIDLGDESIDW